jgi:hypothetical protein
MQWFRQQVASDHPDCKRVGLYSDWSGWEGRWDRVEEGERGREQE